MMTNSMLVEAAQYVLLCRIAPSLRHRLVGQLHPIGLTAGVAERQLRTDTLDLASARDSIAQVQRQTREAMVTARATFAWLTGEEAASITLKVGVDLCIALVRAEYEMRAVAISSHIAEMDVAVSQRALRIVLTASLIAMIDMLPHLRSIELRSTVSGRKIEIHFDLHFADPIQTHSLETERQALRWEHVEALAANEGAEVFKTGKPLMIKCRFGAVISETRSEPENSPFVHNL
jgi:hypothetical protein